MIHRLPVLLAAFGLSAGCASAPGPASTPPSTSAAPSAAPQAPVQGLRLEEVSVADSRWGPEKKDANVFPGEHLRIRLAVAGLTQKNGGIKLGFAAKIVNDKGDVLFEEDKSIKGEDYFRHPSFSFSFGWRAPFPHQGGSYRIQMQLTDQWEGKSISRDFVLNAVPLQGLTILNAAFLENSAKDGDAEERPGRFVVGEVLKLRFFVCKFARNEQGRVSLRGDLQIRDEKGVLLIDKTLIEHEGAADNDAGTMSYTLGLHRPGRFTARVVFADLRAGTTVTRDLPFEVAELDTRRSDF